MYRIGIDVGGTFTDLVAVDDFGKATLAKVQSTPEDPSEGVLEGLQLLAETLGLGLPMLLAQTERIVHGTTVATNALLEGKGAKVGMLVTEGHRDVIEMREGLKPERYNLRMPPPAPLVPRRLRLPIRERIRGDGAVETPLEAASLAAALDRLENEGVQSVAVCFLHSWRNPGHEHEAAAAARACLPHAYVTASAEVLPEIKEFERFSTTATNAAVGPVISAYLQRLSARLAKAGFGGTLFVILSHGGLASVAEAARLAAGTALSGPAGGVAAAVALAREGVARDLITFDMGGTSTDIALVCDAQPALAAGRAVGDARIALPALDIVTLGAGGGSIAHLDRSGLLQVGPESAGADPGPACYGLGGQHPTVTDANLMLGYLDPAGFLGGRRRLDIAAAEAALERLAVALGIGTIDAAAGIHRLINARMADGVRLATVQRGVDPRRHTMLAFGGAAGLHISAVAAELGIAHAVVPIAAPVLSAWGMLNTDLRVELTRSQPQLGGIDPTALRAAYAEMEREGRERLGWFQGEVVLRRAADMRYGEQVFEISVPLDDLDWDAPDIAQRIEAAFHCRHEALYTYSLPDQDVVLANARVSVTGRLPPVAAIGPQPGSATAPGYRYIHLGDWTQVLVLNFASLEPGASVDGPAIIESDATTVLLRPGDRARFDARGWLAITLAVRT